MSVCICECSRMCVCVCVHECVSMSVCVWWWGRCIFMNVWMWMYMYVHECVCICVCSRMCKCVWGGIKRLTLVVFLNFSPCFVFWFFFKDRVATSMHDSRNWLGVAREWRKDKYRQTQKSKSRIGWSELSPGETRAPWKLSVFLVWIWTERWGYWIYLNAAGFMLHRNQGVRLS